jgi:tetratricopeptide (TPR) repeat protein
MNENYENGSESEPQFLANWRTYQGRGIIAKLNNRFEDAIVQFSIAAFVLVVDDSHAARLCRAESLVALACVYMKLRSYDKALQVLEEAMAVRSGLLPSCHSLEVEALHLAANAYRGLGRFDEAHRCYEQGSDCCFKIVGQDHTYCNQVVTDWMASTAERNARYDLQNYIDGRQSA